MSRAVFSRPGLRVGLVLFSALFAAQAAILVLSPILPLVGAEFGVSTAVAAQLRAVSGVTAGGVAIVLATIGGRFRLSALLGWGLALLGIGSLGSAWSPHFLVLMGAQVVIGLGLAAVLSGGLAASEAWAPDGQRARVLSWALIGQPVAWIVGQPIVGVAAAVDWRWAWIAVPFASSVLALAALRGRDRSNDDQGQECDPLGLWRQSGVRTWAAAELLAFAAWAGTLIYAGAVFIESYDLDVGATGLVLGLGAVFYLPGNSWGRRWLHRGPRLLMVGFSLVAGLFVALFVAGRVGWCSPSPPSPPRPSSPPVEPSPEPRQDSNWPKAVALLR